MLLSASGERTGSISGGCLESDVCQKAVWWTNGATTCHVQTYDTLTDEEAAQEFGLGCNGIVRVLLEPIGGKNARADDLRQFLNARQAGAICGAAAVVIDVPPGSSEFIVGQRLFYAGGKFAPSDSGDWQSSRLRAVLVPYFCEVMSARKSRTVSCCLSETDTVSVFVEFFTPPPPLVVFGGGHDVVPLVRLAKTLGWHVSVVESRPAFAHQDCFPDADCVVFYPSTGGELPFPIDKHAAVLVMNHRYGEDCALLRDLLALPVPPRYLGVLGPRTRAEKMLAEIGVADAPWPPHLHAPVGLDIGADTPETIALSILSEIQACWAERSGGKLRERPGPINERDE